MSPFAFFRLRDMTFLVLNRLKKMEFSPTDHGNCQDLGFQMFKMDVSKKQISYFPERK